MASQALWASLFLLVILVFYNDFSLLLWTSLFLLVVMLLAKAFSVLVWTPLHIQRSLRAQGIQGPSYTILVGNLPAFSALTKAARAAPFPHVTHDIMPRVLPHYVKWSAQYGNPFVYWLGYIPRITLPDPELCKEMLSNKFGHYQKPEIRLELQDLLAKGLVFLEGEKWAQHRRIVSPAFFLEKLKAMVPTIANLANDMLLGWQSQLQKAGGCKEIDASEEFKTLTADIISHTAFGSSYAEGKQVFELQYEQQRLFVKLGGSVYIPGSRFIPTPTNRFRWRLSKRINTTLETIIRKRLDSCDCGKDAYGNDLLGLMLSAYKEELQGSQKNLKMSLEEIFDECKTFFFAGHETTSSLLTWTVMLLAFHPEWQELAREEVFSHFNTGHPDADSLNNLKLVGMILHESLRLYPPAIGVFRKASKDTKLGDISIAEGTTFFVPILSWHVDPRFWGVDALEFNPRRFADGVLKACKHPLAFLPFGTGPRACVGQNFTMIEAKTVLCMILQRFRFRLSPEYKHAPTVVLTLQPEHGMQIILENVDTR